MNGIPPGAAEAIRETALKEPVWCILPIGQETKTEILAWEPNTVKQPLWKRVRSTALLSMVLTFSALASAQTCPTWAGPWKGKLGKVDQRVAPHCMSDAEIEQLMALGKGYKTPEKLWKDEFRGDLGALDDQGHPQKDASGDELSSATFYTATTLHILTDAWRIASGALQATHELRAFSLADARLMANSAFTVAVVAAATGSGQNATRNVHLVLDLSGEILQPADKKESNITLSRRVGFGTQRSSTMNGEFAFLLPNDHAPTARIILIDYKNKQHSQIVDFSRLR